jgi:hypothetical protein
LSGNGVKALVAADVVARKIIRGKLITIVDVGVVVMMRVLQLTLFFMV